MPELLAWWSAGNTVGTGTVVATWRSAPRAAGASMLVGPGGEAVGSVSGGCVEGAVYQLAQDVVAGGTAVLQRYGVNDDDALAVGLTCGGIVDAHVDRLERLRGAGLSNEELGRLSSPIGLDLGARTPEETAVSIAAEIVQLRWGGQGGQLSNGHGSLHQRPEREGDATTK